MSTDTATIDTPVIVLSKDELAHAAQYTLAQALMARHEANTLLVDASIKVHAALSAGASVRSIAVPNSGAMGNKDAVSRWGIVGMAFTKDSTYVDSYDGLGNAAEAVYSLVRKGVDAGVGLPQQREVIAAAADSVAAVKALTKAVDEAIKSAKESAKTEEVTDEVTDEGEGSEGEGEVNEPTVADMLAAASGPIAKAVQMVKEGAAISEDTARLATALAATLTAIANAAAKA